MISPLIVDSSDAPSDYQQDNEDFVEEQTMVARLIHLMQSQDLDEQYMVSVIVIVLLSN